jgi:hypothetical protein
MHLHDMFEMPSLLSVVVEECDDEIRPVPSCVYVALTDIQFLPR